MSPSGLVLAHLSAIFMARLTPKQKPEDQRPVFPRFTSRHDSRPSLRLRRGSWSLCRRGQRRQPLQRGGLPGCVALSLSSRMSLTLRPDPPSQAIPFPPVPHGRRQEDLDVSVREDDSPDVAPFHDDTAFLARASSGRPKGSPEKAWSRPSKQAPPRGQCLLVGIIHAVIIMRPVSVEYSRSTSGEVLQIEVVLEVDVGSLAARPKARNMAPVSMYLKPRLSATRLLTEDLRNPSGAVDRITGPFSRYRYLSERSEKAAGTKRPRLKCASI